MITASTRHRPPARASVAVGNDGGLDGPDGVLRADVGPGRIVVLAVAAALVQAFALDASSVWLLRQPDLPLTLAAVAVVAAPGRSATIGLAFGLAVDATGHRLFGIHCLAFTVLGPVARHLPVPGAIRSLGIGATIGRAGAETAWLVGGQVAAATAVVLVGQSLAAGRPIPPDRLVPAVVTAAALAPFLAAWLGGGGRRPGVGRWRRHRGLGR